MVSNNEIFVYKLYVVSFINILKDFTTILRLNMISINTFRAVMRSNNVILVQK